MTTSELARKVKNMRYAQGEYFKTRDRAALDLSKRLEREVDAAVDEILGEAAFAEGGQAWAEWNAGMLNFGD